MNNLLANMLLFGFISRRVELYKQKTIDSANIIWDNFFKGGLFALFSAAILWFSVFLYIAFYYYYMPSVYHHRPVHLQFKTCDSKDSGMCSYPTAHVQLTKYQQLLMVGQMYRIYLKLEMPESQNNKDLGMFMVCAQLADKDGIIVSNNCRSAMLHYRSEFLSLLSTITFYPLLVFGNAEEKQVLNLELYSNYEEDQNHPVTDIYIELQTRRVEYYSASIHIQAHLKGIRYLMFHWPLLSAVVGICSNLFFIVFLISLSWWQVQIRGYKEDDENGDSSFGDSDKDSDSAADLPEQQLVFDENDENNDAGGSFGSASFPFYEARHMIETLVKRQRPRENLPET